MKNNITDALCLGMIYAALLLLSTLVFPAHGEGLNEVERQISLAAIRHGVDPTLAMSIAEVESKFNESAVGKLGEIGIFQLRPEFHDVKAGRREHNIEVAMKYLARLQVLCRRYGDAYFVCYNSGPYRKLKAPKQSPYFRKVMNVVHRRIGNPRIIANAND